MEHMIFIFIGFATSFIGTLSGGGGLIGMPAMLAVGVPIHQAIAAAKFSNMLSSFSSFLVLLRKKKIRWIQAAPLITISILGGITGSLIASSFSEREMTVIAIGLLSFALGIQFLKKRHSTRSISTLPKKLYPLLYGIGIYDGMFGPGQSTLLMYTYLRSGFEYLSSIALTRFQTFLSCSGAFFTYLYMGHFNWRIAIFLAFGSIIGAQTSVRFANRLSKKHVQFLLHTVTILLIAHLASQLIEY